MDLCITLGNSQEPRVDNDNCQIVQSAARERK